MRCRRSSRVFDEETLEVPRNEPRQMYPLTDISSVGLFRVSIQRTQTV